MLAALQADSSLYKFKSVESEQDWDHLRQLIVDGMAYFAKPLQLNDLFECKPEIEFEGTNTEKRQYAARLFEKFRPGLSEDELVAEIARACEKTSGFGTAWANHLQKLIHRKLEKELGIFCLTEAASHPLMWAHYGAGHAGLCIEFHCDAQSAFWNRTMKVEYRADYPRVNPLRQSDQEIALNSVMVKGHDWAYEKEWRIVDFERGSGTQNLPVGSLRSVILGARIPEPAIARVKALVLEAQAAVAIHRASPDVQGYRLDLLPVKL